MYGTVEPSNQSTSNHESNNLAGGAPSQQTTTVAIGSNGNSMSNEQELRRRQKRIYSHCHVQAPDDGTNRGSPVDVGARRRLIAASIICLVFMIGEVVGGVLSNSLAIATDAAHLLTDFASFMISLFAIWLSSRPASKKMSFGWYRAEVIGALVSVLMIWLVTGLLVYMAVERLRTGDFEIDSLVMVITAAAGLLVNIIMAVALHADGHSHGFHSHGHSHGHGHGHHNHHDHSHQEHIHEDHGDDQNCERIDIVPNGTSTASTANNDKNTYGSLPNGHHPKLSTTNSPPHVNRSPNNERGRGKSNINVRAAFIHVIGDFLQSLGVLIAALVIHFEPSYTIVDPICTFIFSIIVLITTLNIIKDAINVLMEGIPDGINFIEVRERLQSLPSVIRVHNLRIWSLSLDKIAISTHLVIDSSKRTPSQVLKEAIELLKGGYNIFEVTIQIEEFKDDMKDCEHCQDEEVVVSLVNDQQIPSLQSDKPSV